MPAHIRFEDRTRRGPAVKSAATGKQIAYSALGIHRAVRGADGAELAGHRYHAKETTGHCGPVLVGSLNGDLTGVKLAAGGGCGNHIAFPALSAVPNAAGSLPTALRRDWSLEEPKVV